MTCQNKKRWTDIHFMHTTARRARMCVTTVRSINLILIIFDGMCVSWMFSFYFHFSDHFHCCSYLYRSMFFFRDASLQIFSCGVVCAVLGVSQLKYLRRNRAEITGKKINLNSIGMSANFVFHLPAKLSL